MLISPLQPAEGRAKYMQVRDALYEQITRSDLQPGDKLWTESELIDSLGVSITTVRKAIDELVRLDLVERRVGRGTFLKSLPPAAAPVSNFVSVLGFQSWSNLLSDYYYGEILQALDVSLQDAGLQLQISTRQWGHDAERDLRDLSELKPGAIIFPFSDIRRKQFVFKLQTLGIPLLLLNHSFPEYDGPVIGSDCAQGARLAAEHLIACGLKDFALLAGPKASPLNETYARSFAATLAQAGFSLPREHVFFGDYTEAFGFRAAERLLKTTRSRIGIFCASDLIAYGAINSLEKNKVDIPHEAAVVGSGGFHVSSLFYPRLTTIQMNCNRLGDLAGQWARHTLGREAADWAPACPVHFLPVHLKQGTTTAPCESPENASHLLPR